MNDRVCEQNEHWNILVEMSQVENIEVLALRTAVESFSLCI